MSSVITVTALATLPRIVQGKFPHQDPHATMTSHIPNHITTTTVETDPSLFITDAGKEYALTSQDHTINLTMAEAPATIGGMHPTLHPITTAVHDTHPAQDALGNTLAGTHYTGTPMVHLQHATLPARVTLTTVLQAKVNLVWDTLIILPADCTHGRHQSHNHKQQPIIDLTIKKKVTIQDSESDSSSESDNGSDPLNY